MSDEHESNITVHVDHASGPSHTARTIFAWCPKCGGRGEFGEEFGEMQKCPKCGGDGHVPVVVHDYRGQFEDTDRLRRISRQMEGKIDE